MRVAVDTSFLSRAPNGTRTYLEQLLRHLPTVAPDIEMVPVAPDRPIASRFHQARWEIDGVARAASVERPDLLHVPTFSAPLRASAPVVVTIHDVIPLVLPEYRRSRAMRAHLAVISRTVRRAAAVITPSQHAADDVVRVLGVDSKRVHVTPEAVDESMVPAADVHASTVTLERLGVEGRYVFNIGGLDVRKGIPLLLEAFTQVRRELDEPIQLVIAGAAHTGNPHVYPPIEPLIERLGLSQSVRLPGRVTEQEKLALYQGAAVYVTPSSYEGFGLTALEAMACGVPVVAADRTSLPEVVGDAGMLVDLDAGAIADAIRRVLIDEGLATELRGRGFARAASFSWRETARLTADVYRGAVNL